MDLLETLDCASFDDIVSQQIQQKAIQALEGGKVIFLPKLSFKLTPSEEAFLSPHIVNPKSKNISYDIRNDKLGGALSEGGDADNLKAMVRRYALSSRRFFEHLFPHYSPYLIQARTSYRPVEASGRKQSYRKDDTRLHVDAFPSTPAKGQRIIRFFTNVNPEGKPRVWRLGEPFHNVVAKIGPTTKRPFPGLAYLMQALKITKGYRTLYDHYMLQLHDNMKYDMEYQKNAPQQEIRFPAGSSWIVYSDQVSHAAMAGQYMFEQTFHLPVHGMLNPNTSPLKVLEKYFNQPMV